MTAVQTPSKATDTLRVVTDAVGAPEYTANSEAAMLAELQTAMPKLWLWTREKYYQAAEAGIFGPEGRLELIEGEVYYKVSPQSSPHAASVARAAQSLRRSFSEESHIREEKPIILSDLTELEPDVAVIRGTLEEDWEDHPTAADVALLIEVSVSTVKFDQTRKAALYARAEIADYWLLNIAAHQLEVRRDPGLLDSGEYGYRSLEIIPADGQISPLAMRDAVIRVADMLPRRQQN